MTLLIDVLCGRGGMLVYNHICIIFVSFFSFFLFAELKTTIQSIDQTANDRHNNKNIY